MPGHAKRRGHDYTHRFPAPALRLAYGFAGPRQRNRSAPQRKDTAEISLSPTTLDGRYSLRICIVNFRTRQADIDWLVEHGLAFGREAHAAGD